MTLTRNLFFVLLGAGLLWNGRMVAEAQPPKVKRTPLLHREAPPIEKPAPYDNYFKGKLSAQTQEMLSDVVLQDVVDQMWEQADHHGHEGEYNHFINICLFVGQANPQFKTAFETGSYLLRSMGRFDEALEVLKQGLKANPKEYYFYDELGQFYLIAKSDPQTAITYYEQAIKFNSPWMTHNMLATCYERTNQLEKALKALERAATFPDNRNARRRLENLRRRIEVNGKKKP